MENTFVKSSEFVSTGGNIMNHIITLNNGFIIRVSDEGISIYKNEDCDLYGESCATVEFTESEYLNIEREFFIKDKSGRDNNGKLHYSHFVKHWNLDQLNDSEEMSLGEYLDSAEIGDEYETDDNSTSWAKK